MIISTTSTGEQRRFTIERLRERPHSTNDTTNGRLLPAGTH